MKRTNVMLPAELKHRAEQAAKAQGISLGELIRTSLEACLRGVPERDPLFADEAVFDGKAAPELVRDHDRYLYDDLH